jgi:energy-coupling factor transport system permease/ATP-binding protein
MREGLKTFISEAPKPLRIGGLKPIGHRLDEALEAELAGAITLEPGTLTVVIGRNGIGKSTLLEKLAGLREPEGVYAAYGDEPVWRLGRRDQARRNEQALLMYSYVPQAAEMTLFAPTVKDELRYSAAPYRLSASELDERTDAVLDAVGWDSTWLERSPYRLSGGERRRAALAAAFVTPAPWLLLDEPTAGLDGEGHAQLAAYLQQAKKKGTGIVLISHDLDWALPMADGVLLLGEENSCQLCSVEQLLAQPSLLKLFGMEVPEWLQTAHRLHIVFGVPLDEVFKADQAAYVIDRQLQAEDQLIRLEETAIPASQDAIAPRPRRPRAKQAPDQLAAFDPRAIWLAYVLLSIGIFLQSTWTGIAIAASITVVALIVGRISLWRWRSLIRTYVIFSLIAALFYATGTQGHGLKLDSEQLLRILLPLCRTLLVLLLGLAVALVMTPLSLRSALRQLLGYRGKTFAVANQFILIVTIMVRFIPVLIAEWSKFSRIALSRGKQSKVRPWRMIGRLREMMIPYLLSIFRLGEEVAVALESRGVEKDRRPTRAVKLRYGRRDYVLSIFAVVIMALLARYSRG